MAILIKMPALSPTMVEGNLTKWIVKEGDNVNEGDILAEIETDKASMEIEAIDKGKVEKILILEGSNNIKVGSLLAIIKEEGDNLETIENILNKSDISSNLENEINEVNNEKIINISTVKKDNDISSKKKIIQNNTVGSINKRIFISPLAKRIAITNKIDFSKIIGSGPKGRIIKVDIDKLLNQQSLINIQENKFEETNYKDIEISNMRKVIAERLGTSKSEAPHFYLTIDCNIENLLSTRKLLNESLDNDQKISVNDFLIKASATALIDVPEANSSWQQTHCRYFKHADICVAVAIPDGLITPVINKVEKKGLKTISTEIKDLASRAKEGKLKPDEYNGGTFTISNLGMYGIKNFTAVINPPQSMILAIGAGEMRPLVQNGQIVTANVMTVTLSCDHRIIDGAIGSRWLASFKKMVENPSLMLL